MKIKEFEIEISKKNVCALIDAEESSDLYDEVMEEIEEMLPLAYEKIKPVALLEFGDFLDYADEVEEKGVTEALYTIHSIGGEMSAWSTGFFREGDYLRGMLADAMADDYLFQMDSVIQKKIIALCKEKKRGVLRRLEAPQDVPMTIQKKAFDVTDAEHQIGLKIKDSYMYDPVKTVCQVYLLDQDDSRFCVEHDCTRCDNKNCKMRNELSVSITVKMGEKECTIQGKKNKTLLEALRDSDMLITAVCAGKGICGKCRVQVLEGDVPASKTDLQFFTQQELEQGFRLSCRAYPRSNCTILLTSQEKDGFFVLAEEPAERKEELCEDGLYGIAVDIGTTTVAMQLVDLEQKKVVDVFTAMNTQRVYGADVISRIEASNGGKKEELKNKICEILREGIRKLSRQEKLAVRKIVIGANTTMVHLLMGYSCESLGVYPFTPVNIKTIHTTAEQLLDCKELKAEIVIYPGISTYVGGDITAGLYELEFASREKPAVLIDLGTNGEMAIGNQERILVTSTAAGPAFEGGNIVCGTGSIPGAISRVKLEGQKVILDTIGEEVPKGICGTGVIDTIYELVQAEIVDETGRMEDAYFEEGFLLSQFNNIRFYQKDVRELQLAKSAVRAGLETLIRKYGTACEEIEKIYVAGGFGYKMDIDKAVGIGLLPKECREKIEAVGNTCLKGAVKYLLQEDAQEQTERLAEAAEEISLSTDPIFQEYYMEYMYFEE